MAMPLKHIAFHDVSEGPWIQSQARWLELSVAAGGLRSAWGAVAGKQARAVFDWETEDALRGFMEQTHDKALADAGTVGKSAVLYLTPLIDLGPRNDAGYLGETVAWLKEGADSDWVESQRAWYAGMKECDGFVGGSLARGRRTYVSTTFWRDRDAHKRFDHDVAPGIRARTSDQQVARMVRFEAPLIPSLCR
jgi:heme-degrading monooxygenase HmoA